nr:MAG TPA: hypothetical protein [Herelleviridae sp.]
MDKDLKEKICLLIFYGMGGGYCGSSIDTILYDME